MITNYSTLQTAVLSEMHRPGDTLLSTEMPRFVQLAENEIFRELSLRITEATATGTTSGDTIAIPAGMSAPERLEITSAGTRYTMDYTSPNGIEGLTLSTGLTRRFTVESGSFRLIPAPAGAYTYTLYYLPNLTALSDSNTSNWLLLNAPDVYLQAVTIQASLWAKDYEEAARRRPILIACLDSVARADQRRRLPVSGGLQIKPRNAR